MAFILRGGIFANSLVFFALSFWRLRILRILGYGFDGFTDSRILSYGFTDLTDLRILSYGFTDSNDYIFRESVVVRIRKSVVAHTTKQFIMNIREALEQEHSKTQTLRIVSYIGDDAALMAELMVCFFDTEWRLCQRAAWAVGLLGEKKAYLVEPYLEQMLLHLKLPHHDALARNTMRTLHAMPEIPENALGLTVDVAFRFLENPSVPTAIRMFSMRVLAKICKKEPDLKDELRLLIEDILAHEKSAGIVSAGRSVILELKIKN
jgi:hypothetical protein